MSDIFRLVHQVRYKLFGGYPGSTRIYQVQSERAVRCGRGPPEMLKDICKEEDVGLEIVVVIVFECFAPKARPRLLRPLIVLLLQILASQGVPERLDRRELRLLELFGSRHVAVVKNALREHQIGSSEMLLSVCEIFLARFQKNGDQFL